MSDFLHVRTAEKSDLRSLLKLYRQLNRSDPELTLADAERIWEQIDQSPGVSVFVSLVSGEIVTTCMLVVVPNLTRGGAPYALIENVVTDSAHRKKGHGRRILDAAISAVWEAGCYKVMLLTGRNEPETLRFYQGAGFQQNKTGFQIRRAGC